MGYVTPAWDYVPIIHCWCRADREVYREAMSGLKETFACHACAEPWYVYCIASHSLPMHAEHNLYR